MAKLHLITKESLCSDGSISNKLGKFFPTVLFRVFQILSLIELLPLFLTFSSVPGFLYIFCCFHKEIQCVFFIFLVVRIRLCPSDNKKVVQKVLGLRTLNLPQQRDNWSWFTRLDRVVILLSVQMCFAAQNRVIWCVFVGEFWKYLQVKTVSREVCLTILRRLWEALRKKRRGALAGTQLVSWPWQSTRAHGAVHAEVSR